MKGHTMKDEEIIALYFGRDARAAAETKASCGAYCFTVANNILHSAEDAEECVNDALLAAWDSIPPARPENLRLYLAKLTRNIAVNRYNTLHAEKRGGGETALVLDELSECIPSENSVIGEIDAKQLSRAVNAFLHTLSRRDAGVFIRRCFYSEPIAQIAKRFHISENNASVILSRTRQKLRSYLEKEGLLNEE